MATKEPYYFIGLMSGTSLDAIDAALVDFSKDTPNLVQHHQHPLPPQLRVKILALCTPGDNEIERMGECDVELGALFAEAALELMQQAKLDAEQIQAIGSHGQTIRHCPNDKYPFTLQIGDPNQIAQRTGITTVADFRRRDMAAGGEGAPLAPIIHREVFSVDHDRAILNIGGIANLTLLPGDKSIPPTGFDTGPGNVLIDTWYQSHQQGQFDRDGNWASKGKVIEPLLSQLLSDPYFQLPPPKSTGRELFNANWLEQQLASYRDIEAQDVCATLVEFSAKTISDHLQKQFPDCRELFVCGGGAHNSFMLERLADQLDGCRVGTTDELGVSPDWVEAIAFAWMAKQTLERKAGNVPSITGADQPCILGGVYYA